LIKNISLSERYFREGLNLFQRNRISEAISYFEKSYKLNPKNELNLFYLGLGYEREGEIEKARKFWEEAIKVDNNFWAPHLLLGISYAEEWLEKGGNNFYLKKAIENYEKVVELNSQDKEIKNFLGILKSYDEKA
jgi:tetratricopeptide (TPR) repeat protein